MLFRSINALDFSIGSSLPEAGFPSHMTPSGVSNATVKLYDGSTLLDTVIVNLINLDFSSLQPFTWVGLGSGVSCGPPRCSPTPIDFTKFNNRTFSGRIDISINSGSISDLLTGPLYDQISGAITGPSVALSHLDPATGGGFGQVISGQATLSPEPSTVWFIGAAAVLFALIRRCSPIYPKRLRLR